MHLVGMKKDLRYQCGIEDHRFGAHRPIALEAFPTCCVRPCDVCRALTLDCGGVRKADDLGDVACEAYRRAEISRVFGFDR